MKDTVMILIGCFMPEKITVCPSLMESPVFCFRLFSNRKCQGTIRISFFYLIDQIGKSFLRKISILASLQHKGPEAQIVSLPAAMENILFCKTVPGCIFIASSDTTVIAVIFAVIGEFDQTSDKNPVSVDFFPNFPCQISGVPFRFLVSF